MQLARRFRACPLLLLGLAMFSTAGQAQDLDVEQLVHQCAPDVHPTTMMTILRHESGLRPFVIGVNGKGPRQVFEAETPERAAEIAQRLIAEGKSIDMGLGQIWSGNLKRLGLTLEQVFDPCTNIRTAAYVLQEAYERTSTRHGEGQAALDQALSIYNTGREDRGVANGYVASVRGKAYVVPSLAEGQAADVAPVQLQADLAGRAAPAPPPAWDVFARARYEGAHGEVNAPAQPAPLPAPTPVQVQAVEPARVMMFDPD